MSTENTVGYIIKKIRIDKGLTQKELAAKLGTTPQNLAQYENGKRNPKFETIKKIAYALGVSPLELTPSINVTDNDTISFFDVFPNPYILSLADYTDMRNKPLTAYFDAWLITLGIAFTPIIRNGVKGYYFNFDNGFDFSNDNCYFVTEEQLQEVRSMTAGYARKLILDYDKINKPSTTPDNKKGDSNAEQKNPGTKPEQATQAGETTDSSDKESE